MKTKHIYQLSIYVSVVFLVSAISMATQAKTSSKKNKGIYDTIAQQYAQVCGDEDDEFATAEQGRIPLTEREKLLAICNTLSAYEHKKKHVFNNALPTQSWISFNLLTGKDNPEESLLGSFTPEIYTVSGEIVTARMLTQPTTDTKELAHRQNAIKELINNTELSQRISEHLEIIQQTEETLLSFWYARDEETFEPLFYKGDDQRNNSWMSLEISRRLTDLLKLGPLPLYHIVWPLMKHYRGAITKEKSFSGATKDLKEETKQKWKMKGELYTSIITGNEPKESTDYFEKNIKEWKKDKQKIINSQNNNETFEIQRKTLVDLINKNSPFFMTIRLENISAVNLKEAQKEFIDALTRAIERLERLSLGLKSGDKNTVRKKLLPNFLTDFGLHSFFIYLACTYLNKLDLSQKLREKMNDLHTCLHEMDALVACVQENEHLQRVIHCKGASLEALQEKVSDLRVLMSNLDSWSVKYPSHLGYFIFPVGKAYAAYKRMIELKDEFAPLMEAVGEIDAYNAVAHYYISHADHEIAPLCFAQYIHQNLPEIHATHMWNPLLDQESVLANDVAFGARFSSANALLKGSDAEGKSTLLKAIMLNTILALTFGIATAHEMHLTPFAKFNTHINSVDETEGGSLYQDEAYSAKSMAHTIENLKHNEFCLTIADEMFSSIKPQEATALFLGLWNHLGNHVRNMSIIATQLPHAPLLSDITENRFKNYTIESYSIYASFYNYEGKLIPYEQPLNFIPELSAHAAINILMSLGFNPAITGFALDVMRHPENYPLPKEIVASE